MKASQCIWQTGVNTPDAEKVLSARYINYDVLIGVDGDGPVGWRRKNKQGASWEVRYSIAGVHPWSLKFTTIESLVEHVLFTVNRCYS
jgi:hypothetical protein